MVTSEQTDGSGKAILNVLGGVREKFLTHETGTECRSIKRTTKGSEDVFEFKIYYNSANRVNVRIRT